MQDFAPFTPELLGPPLRGGGGSLSWPSTRLLNRFEYTSFWGSYAPDHGLSLFLTVTNFVGIHSLAIRTNVSVKVLHISSTSFKLPRSAFQSAWSNFCLNVSLSIRSYNQISLSNELVVQFSIVIFGKLLMCSEMCLKFIVSLVDLVNKHGGIWYRQAAAKSRIWANSTGGKQCGRY